jgi:hypothetical protein
MLSKQCNVPPATRASSEPGRGTCSEKRARRGGGDASDDVGPSASAETRRDEPETPPREEASDP